MQRIWFCRVEADEIQKDGLYFSEIGELLEGTYVEISDIQTCKKEIARIISCFSYSCGYMVGESDFKGSVTRIASKSEYEEYTGVIDEGCDESIEALEAAAKGGDAGAFPFLVRHYFCDENYDPEKMYYYASLGALLYNNPCCYHYLSVMKELGILVDKNYRQAFGLLQKALAQFDVSIEDAYNKSVIQRILSRYYLEGIGVERNLEQAVMLQVQSIISLYKSGKYEIKDYLAYIKMMISDFEMNIK